jgi:uncharacterized protein (TIGR02145 family)
MKNIILISAFIGLSIIMLSIHACSKEENPTNDKTTAVFNPNISYGSLTDQDGNNYKTVTIGSQIWMAENLRTTKYRNGDEIPEITDSTAWINLSTGAYCNYQNTRNIDTIATFGRLYNWYTVNDSRNIAPEGWHVPNYDEWKILENNLGGDSIAGGKLKETGTIHWQSPNKFATNESGFTALPGGCRWGGQFNIVGGTRMISIGKYGFWWTATEDSASNQNAWHRHIWTGWGYVGGCKCPKIDGYSIRLVKN